MLMSIKEKVINVFYRLIYMLGCLISFFVDIVTHPIKNISCILVFGLYCLLHKTNIYELSGKQMFLFSAGMVTILTFIVTFLQSVTVESSNKKNFYFGYNLKRNLYDDFWIKRLYEMHVKLFLWLIFLIPCLRISTNYKYECKVLNNFNVIICKNSSNLYCIWVSVIVIVCIYCAAILIESINITKNKFRLNNFYDPENVISKLKIELEVEKEYKNNFKNVINGNNIGFLNISDNQENAYDLIDYLFKRASEVTNTPEEFNEYLEHAFRAENDCIHRLFIKIDYFINSICKTKNSDILRIKVFLLKKCLEKVKWYYVEKWNSIKHSSYYMKSFLATCTMINNDLIILDELENKFIYKREDIEKIYNASLRRNHFSKELFRVNGEMVENICISHIIDVLMQMCQKPEFYEELDFTNDIYKIFKTLNRGHDSKNYISMLFRCIFDYVLKCENRDGKFTKEFCNILKLGYVDQFILNEAKNCSYKQIMRGDNISDFQLKWLLSLINDNDVIVSLIFCIAYAERSRKGYMSAGIYSIWKERINELLYKNELYELNNDRYVDELIEKIKQSHVSHFIYPEFIKWLWESFFVEFDSIMYQEFQKLGDSGIRKNFDLCSYMILRSLLMDEENAYNSLLFTKSENNEIQKELLQIKEIGLQL